jgi:hypothetical protein
MLMTKDRRLAIRTLRGQIGRPLSRIWTADARFLRGACLNSGTIPRWLNGIFRPAGRTT